MFVRLRCSFDLLFAEHAGLVLKSGTGFGSGLFAALNDGDVCTIEADAGTGALAACVEALTVPLLALSLRASTAFAYGLLDALYDRPRDLILQHQHV